MIYKWMIVLICFTQPIFGYSIVFVHIGNSIPSYTQYSLKQASLFNPNAQIVLLGNQKALQKFSLPDVANISCFALEDLPKSKEHLKFLYNRRNNFWSYTTERFYYLKEFMHINNLHDVFHLENDVMLYSDLEKNLETFQTLYPGIGATFDDDERCIAGFMYIAKPESLNALTAFFTQNLRKKLNDMYLIGLFKKNSPKEIIDHLPIIISEYAIDHPLASQYGARYYQHFEAFGMIFDAAALGQYLGGTDSIAGGAGAGFINETCLFNPSFLNYEWTRDIKGRKIPLAYYHNQRIPIANLHIHSKKLAEFISWED